MMENEKIESFSQAICNASLFLKFSLKAFFFCSLKITYRKRGIY